MPRSLLQSVWQIYSANLHWSLPLIYLTIYSRPTYKSRFGVSVFAPVISKRPVVALPMMYCVSVAGSSDGSMLNSNATAPVVQEIDSTDLMNDGNELN